MPSSDTNIQIREHFGERHSDALPLSCQDIAVALICMKRIFFLNKQTINWINTGTYDFKLHLAYSTKTKTNFCTATIPKTEDLKSKTFQGLKHISVNYIESSLPVNDIG